MHKLGLGVIIHDKHQHDDNNMRYVKSFYSRGNMLISRFKTFYVNNNIASFGMLVCKTKQYVYSFKTRLGASSLFYYHSSSFAGLMKLLNF